MRRPSHSSLPKKWLPSNCHGAVWERTVIVLYYIRNTTMANSPQSIRIPPGLDAEVNQFVEETGIYASKSEFIREAVRTHLQELHTDAGILTLRLHQALARADSSSDHDHDTIHETLDTIADDVEAEAVEAALQAAEEDVAAAVLGDQADTE